MDGVGTVWNDRSGWTSQVEVSCSVNLAGGGKKVPGTERRGLFCLFSFVLLSFVFVFGPEAWLLLRGFLFS